MPYSNISASLSDADRDKILAYLTDAWKLLPFLVNLTNDEKKNLPKMGDKSVAFVEKSLDYSESTPKLVPPFLDVTELRKDVDLVKQLNPIYNLLSQLFDALDGTYTVLGSEAMVASLSFYHTARDASKKNVPGSKAIYDDLKKRFPGRTPGKAVPPATPPAK